jgi:hypothetical protein
MVAVEFAVTAVVLAVKEALVWPAAMVTDAGTVNAALLSDSVTTVEAEAAPVSAAVHETDPGGVSDVGVHVRPASETTLTTGAIRLIVALLETP